MFTTVSVQLSPTSLLRLVEWQRREGGAHDLSETLNSALDFWLDAKTALPPGADPAMPAIAPAAPIVPAPAVETTPAPAPARAGKTDFDPGWDLPERRKFRCRLEDIAY